MFNRGNNLSPQEKQPPYGKNSEAPKSECDVSVSGVRESHRTKSIILGSGGGNRNVVGVLKIKGAR